MLEYSIPQLKTAISHAPTISNSRISWISSSYTAPQPSEVPGIHEYISNSVVYLSQLHVLLAETLKAASAVQREIDRASNLVSMHNSALHPIRQLPNEVLSLIFSLCVEKSTPSVDRRGSLYPRLHSCNPRSMPWPLTQVCSRWRETAIADTSLWTSIIVTLSKTSLSIPLTTQISRAGNRSLSLTLLNKAYFPGECTFDSIIPFAARITSITFAIDMIADLSVFHQQLLSRLPQIRSFHSTSHHFDLEDVVVQIPLLTTLCSPCSRFDHHPVVMPELLEYRKPLALQGTDFVDSCIIFLKNAPKLQKASFYTDALGRYHMSSVTTHKSLKVLELQDSLTDSRRCLGASCLLLESLCLPSLQTLTIQGPIMLSRLSAFFRQSNCLLQSLILAFPNVDTMDYETLTTVNKENVNGHVARFMDMFPRSLVTLELGCPQSYMFAIVESIANGSLPSLEHLSLHIPEGRHVEGCLTELRLKRPTIRAHYDIS